MDVKFESGRGITWDDSLYENSEVALTNNYDLGAAEGIISSQVAPYFDGEGIYDETLAPRDILFEYHLISDSNAARDLLIQTLKTAFNPKDKLGLLTLTLGGGILRSIWCIPNGEPYCLPGTARRPTRQIVQVKLRAPRPFFFDPEIKTATLASFSGGLSFPFRTPWTFGTASSTVTITNNGNVPTPVIITFHGDLTNPRVDITNIKDGIETTKFIKAVMTLAAGEVLRIDTSLGQHKVEYIVGSSNTNGFQYLDSESEFFWLMPGDNLISFSSSSAIGASATCSIEYFEQYIGV
jgi:hypothetical protein